MGFDLVRFQGDVDEELVCPICSGVLEDPVQVCMRLAPVVGDLQKISENPMNEATFKTLITFVFHHHLLLLPLLL